MPLKCCVPGCTSNYGSKSNNSNIKTVFRFPTDPSLKEKWIRSIHRQNFIPTNYSVVCVEHFADSDVIKEDTVTRPDGTLLTVPRERPKLNSCAYPTIFKNQPSYMTKCLPKKRKTPDERQKEIDGIKKQRELESLLKDQIVSFDDFKQNFSKHVDSDLGFSVFNGSKEIVFYILELTESGMPFVNKSICINNNLDTKVYFKNVDVTQDFLKAVRNNNKLKCNTWSKFCSIAEAFAAFSLSKVGCVNDKLKCYIKNASDILVSCMQMDDLDKSLKLKIVFLNEQLDLMLTDSPRYSSQLIIWACTLCFSYPSGYVALRNSYVLTLPHHRYLDTFKMKLGTEGTGLTNQQCVYLKKKKELLSEQETYVNVLLDEVYVRPDVSYKGGKIEGMLMAKDGPKVAETVQTFMINSITSKYKDVIGLFPQTHVTGDELHKLVISILQTLSSIGFRVVSIISDNNRVNRKMFDKLSGGQIKVSIKNPFNEADTIFLLFDTVHIFKCIRNNWMNQKDCEQTLWFPEPESVMNMLSSEEENVVSEPTMYPSNRMPAKLSDLKQLHTSEQDKLVKLAPSLSRKVLYPSNVERQNVSLCSKLFDEKNIAALKTVENTTGTVQFITIILTWWKVVNNKSSLSGKKLRDHFRNPIVSNKDKSITFLKEFVKWLEQWSTFMAFENDLKKRGGTCGKLSDETFFSLQHTTSALVEMSEHLVNSQLLEYVLLGKFQNDDIESRFGQYRQMSGGTYHISVAQILESEKKLKAISMLKIQSSKIGEFHIKDLFLPEDEECTEKEVTSEGLGDICELHDKIKEEDITHSEQMTLIYITGYAVHKVSQFTNCIKCNDEMHYEGLFEVEESAKGECQYLQFIDRGGLKKPKPDFVNILVVMLQLFKYLTSNKFEEEFLLNNSQRQFLYQVSLDLVLEKNIVNIEICNLCKKSRLFLVKKIIFIFCNILLNNYSKVVKDNLFKSKKSEKRKVKKLSS